MAHAPFRRLFIIYAERYAKRRGDYGPRPSSNASVQSVVQRCMIVPLTAQRLRHESSHLSSLTRATRWLTSTQGVRPGSRPRQRATRVAGTSPSSLGACEEVYGAFRHGEPHTRFSNTALSRSVANLGYHGGYSLSGPAIVRSTGAGALTGGEKCRTSQCCVPLTAPSVPPFLPPVAPL